MVNPHSLGILIEWKQGFKTMDILILILYPHSLGILIEWKQVYGGLEVC